jgi:hypothetical protein
MGIVDTRVTVIGGGLAKELTGGIKMSFAW